MCRRYKQGTPGACRVCKCVCLCLYYLDVLFMQQQYDSTLGALHLDCQYYSCIYRSPVLSTTANDQPLGSFGSFGQHTNPLPKPKHPLAIRHVGARTRSELPCLIYPWTAVSRCVPRPNDVLRFSSSHDYSCNMNIHMNISWGASVGVAI